MDPYVEKRMAALSAAARVVTPTIEPQDSPRDIAEHTLAVAEHFMTYLSTGRSFVR